VASRITSDVIRAVGEPKDRFNEDALRMLRAVRFSTQLDFAISYETMNAIVENSKLLKNISSERIRDEFTKIIESKNPSSGIILLQKLGLLKYIIPKPIWATRAKGATSNLAGNTANGRPCPTGRFYHHPLQSKTRLEPVASQPNNHPLA
jgi:tRNA nucleotidyltransferase/poly(A) polymerase